LQLRAIRGFEYKEIASQLGLSEANVRQIVHRSRKNCSALKIARRALVRETPDIMRDDKFEAVIQQAFLDAFPNPDRMGCPGDEVLRSLAANKSIENNEADAHIAQCSPCAKQLLAFRQEARKRRQTRWLWAAAAACLAAVLSFAMYRQFSSHQNVGPDQHETALVIVAKLDFSKELPETRRASEAPSAIRKILPNAQELLIILPGGSPSGEYEFEIRP